MILEYAGGEYKPATAVRHVARHDRDGFQEEEIIEFMDWLGLVRFDIKWNDIGMPRFCDV